MRALVLSEPAIGSTLSSSMRFSFLFFCGYFFQNRVGAGFQELFWFDPHFSESPSFGKVGDANTEGPENEGDLSPLGFSFCTFPSVAQEAGELIEHRLHASAGFFSEVGGEVPGDVPPVELKKEFEDLFVSLETEILKNAGEGFESGREVFAGGEFVLERLNKNIKPLLQKKGGKEIRFACERVTIEPYDLRYRPSYDLVQIYFEESIPEKLLSTP